GVGGWREGRGGGVEGPGGDGAIGFAGLAWLGPAACVRGVPDRPLADAGETFQLDNRLADVAHCALKERAGLERRQFQQARKRLAQEMRATRFDARRDI